MEFPLNWIPLETTLIRYSVFDRITQAMAEEDVWYDRLSQYFDWSQEALLSSMIT